MKQKRSLSSVKVAVIGNHSEEKKKVIAQPLEILYCQLISVQSFGGFHSELIRQWTIHVANTSLLDTLHILTNTIAGAAA